MGFGVRERSSSEMIIRLLRSGNSRVSRTNNQPRKSQKLIMEMSYQGVAKRWTILVEYAEFEKDREAISSF